MKLKKILFSKPKYWTKKRPNERVLEFKELPLIYRVFHFLWLPIIFVWGIYARLNKDILVWIILIFILIFFVIWSNWIHGKMNKKIVWIRNKN